MSTALLVTKQATIAPAGLIGPSWAELREALAESEALHREIDDLNRELQAQRTAADEQVGKLQRQIGRLEFQIDNGRDASTTLKRQNARLSILLDSATKQAEVTALGSPEAKPSVHPNKNSRALEAIRLRASGFPATMARVELRAGVWFDVPGRLLRCGVDFRALSPSEYLILMVLAESRGRRLSSDELGTAVYGADQFLVYGRNPLRARVTTLRSRLAEFGVRDLIPADWTQGYVLLSVPS